MSKCSYHGATSRSLLPWIHLFIHLAFKEFKKYIYLKANECISQDTNLDQFNSLSSSSSSSSSQIQSLGWRLLVLGQFTDSSRVKHAAILHVVVYSIYIDRVRNKEGWKEMF